MRILVALLLLSATPRAEKPRQILQKLIGDWDVRVSVWTRDGKLSDSAGTSERRAILDERFIEESHRGRFFGAPFEEKVLLGYDSAKQKFVSVSADSTRDSFNIAEGTADAQGNLTYFGEERDDSGKPHKLKYVLRFVGPNQHVIEAWDQALGKKVGEVVYTRR